VLQGPHVIKIEGDVSKRDERETDDNIDKPKAGRDKRLDLKPETFISSSKE
jgi:hypothetical protein